MEKTRPHSRSDGTDPARADERGQLLLGVSNAVVRVHKRYYGKGPTKARSNLSQDLLTVVLEGGLTRSEHTLLEHGHSAEVLQSRAAMHQAVEHDLRDAVESLLGRKVRSFMSANDPSADLQVEIFVLEAGFEPPPSSNGFHPYGRVNP